MGAEKLKTLISQILHSPWLPDMTPKSSKNMWKESVEH